MHAWMVALESKMVSDSLELAFVLAGRHHMSARK